MILSTPYRAASFSTMYTGEEISVTLRCQERILDQMIDLFGRESRIVAQGDDHFIICVTASRGGIVYLAQQYLDAMIRAEDKMKAVGPYAMSREMKILFHKKPKNA